MNKEGFQIIKKKSTKKEYRIDIRNWKETHKSQYVIIEINPDDRNYGRILMRSSTPLHMETFDLSEYDANEADCVEIYAENPRLKVGRTLTPEEVKKTIKQKKIMFCGFLLAVSMVLGCGKQEETLQSDMEQELVRTEVTVPIVEIAQSEDTQEDTQIDEQLAAYEYRISIGLVEELEVEAGTQNLTEEIFFTENLADELADTADPTDPTSLRPGIEILTVLSEEQLRAVGETYPVEIKCTDYVYEVPVHIVDTTAPVIHGCGDMYITVGDSVSYRKNIYVTDNSGEDITVEVNTDEVRLGEAGVYTVYYSATDSSGNQTVQTASLSVAALPVIDEAYIMPMADEVIAKVITPEMTQWDQAYALYEWVRNNVTYTSQAGDMSSIWTGAYEGLHNHHGDCFSYYATYSVLLTRVGIPNMCVERIEGDSEHYWNLVNVGLGWYHCDSSPRNRKHPYICFMQTDAQLAAYMETIPERINYYKFDTSLYPERGTQIVFGN